MDYIGNFFIPGVYNYLSRYTQALNWYMIQLWPSLANVNLWPTIDLNWFRTVYVTARLETYAHTPPGPSSPNSISLPQNTRSRFKLSQRTRLLNRLISLDFTPLDSPARKLSRSFPSRFNSRNNRCSSSNSKRRIHWALLTRPHRQWPTSKSAVTATRLTFDETIRCARVFWTVYRLRLILSAKAATLVGINVF